VIKACPAGNVLRSEWRAFKNERSHVTKANTIIFRSRQTDCATCPMKAKCCPNTSIRKIVRSVHEAARNVARRIAATPEYVRSRHERKKVEMLFAHLKRIVCAPYRPESDQQAVRYRARFKRSQR
jgi:hypothetical protein